MNETVVIKVSVDCVMMMMIWMNWGNMNKHVHAECGVFEDIIIMMESDNIICFKATRVRWMIMMMSGEMIDTNRYDGVVFPISMCVRELELRSQKVMERDEDGWEERGREERERSWEKTPFGKEVSLLLLR